MLAADLGAYCKTADQKTAGSSSQ